MEPKDLQLASRETRRRRGSSLDGRVEGLCGRERVEHGARHPPLWRFQLQGRGTLVKTTGDGILSWFDGPARAIRCAIELRNELGAGRRRRRAGLHSGEIERRGDDIAGIGVHIAARVEAKAEPGEVVVSRTVNDLVAGSRIGFADRGVYHLKGVDDDWQLLAVTTIPD